MIYVGSKEKTSPFPCVPACRNIEIFIVQRNQIKVIQQKLIESKICEAEIEEDFDYGEFFASSLSSYGETDDKYREN